MTDPLRRHLWQTNTRVFGRRWRKKWIFPTLAMERHANMINRAWRRK